MDWLLEVYEEHKRALLTAAWTVLRRADLAEDAVHAAFVKLWRGGTVPEDGKVYALRAVRHAALDIARKDRRAQAAEAARPGSATVGGRLARLEEVGFALNGLDDEDRQAVELHLFGDLSFREIGEMIGEPLQTVASRYRRAIEKIRVRLEPAHGRR